MMLFIGFFLGAAVAAAITTIGHVRRLRAMTAETRALINRIEAGEARR